MIKKKLLWLILAAAMLLTACSAAGTGRGSLIRTAVICGDPDVSTYAEMRDKDLRLALTAANGYDAYFSYNYTISDQLAEAQKHLGSGLDVLLIEAIEPDGWEPVLQQAKDSGVPVILIDSPVNTDPALYAARVYSDPTRDGLSAVAWLEKQTAAPLNIVHLREVTESIFEESRTRALENAVADHDDWQLVAQAALECDEIAVTGYIRRLVNGGTAFNVLYCGTDSLARLAVAALDAAGISHGTGGDVMVVSFDCQNYALTALLSGSWNYDSACNPYQSSCIRELIDQLLAGQPLPQKEYAVAELAFDAGTVTEEDLPKYGE